MDHLYWSPWYPRDLLSNIPPSLFWIDHLLALLKLLCPRVRCWEFTTSTPLLVKTDHFKRSCIKYCWHPLIINSMCVKFKTQPNVSSHCIATSNPRRSMTMTRTMSDALLRRITCREIWSALGVDGENNPAITRSDWRKNYLQLLLSIIHSGLGRWWD